MTELITAALTSAGFSILFGLKRKYIPFTSAGGFLCWLIYLAAKSFDCGEFAASFASALAVAFFCEVLARLLKAPATVFFTPSIIPLVPGRTLFYAISFAVSGNSQKAWYFASQTAAVSAAIAVGLGVIISVFAAVSKYKKN